MRFREDDADRAAASEGLLNEEKVVKLPPRSAREAGSIFGKARMEVEDGGRRRVVEVYQTTTCDFRHVLDEKRPVVALCHVGGEFLCAERGCAATCAHCSRPVCADHRRTALVGGETVCARCRLPHLLRHLFGVG